MRVMNEFHKLPSLGELERSNNWGFGDAFQLLCDYTNILANAFIQENRDL